MKPKNTTSNTLGLFLADQNLLKKFTIPKRAPDKGFLTECSTNQRDYSEIKQRLCESCLNTECHLESSWQFDKIEMVHNKDLEEEFVAKRTKMREEGRQDKELFSFLVASKDEVSKICQSGLHVGHATERELNNMKELGNPQLGVYLFRYADVALNYASMYLITVENIIIFKVLLGKIKKIQPPKGKKMVGLDPTPNFDCHMSRIHPLVKDSLEDQAVGSLIYFYEYSEFSKPVDRPRQCLPYAVIKIKCVNQTKSNIPGKSLKYIPKKLRLHAGGGRSLKPLENCTRVTRISKSKLIYEHFRKPTESGAVNSENIDSAEGSCFMGNTQNWNGSIPVIQCSKMKPKSSRWDTVQIGINKMSLQCTTETDVHKDVTNSLNMHLGVFPVSNTDSSTVTTSRMIKDPRLSKREQNPDTQNGKEILSRNGNSQYENAVENGTVDFQYPVLDNFLDCTSQDAFSQREYGEEASWKENESVSEEFLSLSLLETRYSLNDEVTLINVSKAIQGSESTDTGNSLKTNISHSSLKQKEYKNIVCVNNFRGDKGIKDSKLPLTQYVPKMLYKEYKWDDQHPNHTGKDKMEVRDAGATLLGNDDCCTETECSFMVDTTYTKSDWTSSEEESNGSGETCFRNVSHNVSATCRVMGDSGEKNVNILDSEELDMDSKGNFLSSRGWVERRKQLETGHIIEVHDVLKTQASQLEEKSSSLEMQIPPPAKINKAEKSFGNEKGKCDEKTLEENSTAINSWVELSEISEVSVSESSASDFAFNFQARCSLTDPQLIKMESDKGKREDLHSLVSSRMIMDQKENCTAPGLFSSVSLPSENKLYTEIKHQSENTNFLNASFEELNNTVSRGDSPPETFEQGLGKKYGNIRTPNVEFENVLESKKCLPLPQDLSNVPTEEDVYNHLQERIDWDNLSCKPSLKTEVSETLWKKKNENDVEEKTELFNASFYPDLEISLTNVFPQKLNSLSTSFETKTGMGKCATKYSSAKKGVRWLQEKIMKRSKQSWKKAKHFCRKKKSIPNKWCCRLPKRQTKAFLQSEKHVKNILNSLNTEALLCKNKHLSERIGETVLHRSAQKCIQKSLKILAKRPSNLASKLNSSVTSNHTLSLPFSCDNVKNTETAQLETVSEKSMILNTTECNNMKSSSDKYAISSEQETCINVTSVNNIQGEITAVTDKTQQDANAKGCRSKKIAKHLNSDVERGQTHGSNIMLNPVQIITPVQMALESSLEVNSLKADNRRQLTPPCTRLEEISPHEKETLEMPAPQQESLRKRIKSCSAPSAFLPATENKLDTRAYEVHSTPQMNGVGSLSFEKRSNNTSNSNLERKLLVQLEDEKSDCCSSNKHMAEHKLPSSDNKEYSPSVMSLKLSENTQDVSSKSNVNSPIFMGNNDFFRSSHNSTLQEAEGRKMKTMQISEIKKDFSPGNPNIIEAIPVHLSVKISKEQKETQENVIACRKESTCQDNFSKSSNKITRLYSSSLLKTDLKHNIEAITAVSVPYDAMSYKRNWDFTTPETRLDDKCFSSEPSNSEGVSSETKCTAFGFINKISEILQKADELSSLDILHELTVFCKSVLPFFIRAFEEKQKCSFKHVLFSRDILESTEQNIKEIQKLKPCAIESLVELQIVMETIEFIENKMRFIEGKPTFRSLLWYDDTLFYELFGGQSGCQQQSHFYPVFQRRLKYSSLNELKAYHQQLIETFENTRWENNSYYALLKLRRELQECEAAMRSNLNLSDFFLSIPYVCGANYGDTLEDLEHSRKHTFELISLNKSIPGVNLRAEKEGHFLIIMEIIRTKIEFIKACEEVDIKASLLGLEHIFFGVAKSLVWKEKEEKLNEDSKDEKRQMQATLSKLHEIYQHVVNQFGNEKLSNATEAYSPKKLVETYYNCEEGDKNEEKFNITKSLFILKNICYLGEILDEAQYSNIERLEQLVCHCTEHLEMLKKYFQILQEEDVNVLITKDNVLGFMKSGGINSVILKPEAVEVYTEIAMMYETISFLKNSIAKKVDKPRFRSLLWFDLSLVPELFRDQEKMFFVTYRKDTLLEVIDSSISELQDELNAIHDYEENLNCSYALHLLTRELEELAETQKMLQTSKSSISMCVDLVPYNICLNYGNTVSELECNYTQFSSLLEKLMLAERKDLGKMAHIMKIMKTIEHMKFVFSKQKKSPLPLVIYQMLRNWRKSCQLKKQEVKIHLDTKCSIFISGPEVFQVPQKRPSSVTLEDNSNSYKEKKEKRKRNIHGRIDEEKSTVGMYMLEDSQRRASESE